MQTPHQQSHANAFPIPAQSGVSPDRSKLTLLLAQSGASNLQLSGPAEAAILSLLGPLVRGTAVRFQLERPSMPAPQQLDLEVTSHRGAPSFRVLTGSHEDAQESRILSIARDGLPAIQRRDCAAWFNPMIEIWKRPLSISSGWDAFRSSIGGLVTITSRFEGTESTVVGTLSSSEPGNDRFAVQRDDGKVSTYSPKSGVELLSVSTCIRGLLWQRPKGVSDSIGDVHELRQLLPDGATVEATLHDGYRISGTWRGVDDRYLPLIAVESGAAKHRGDGIFAARLQDIASLRTVGIESGGVQPYKVLWKADSSPTK